MTLHQQPAAHVVTDLSALDEIVHFWQHLDGHLESSLEVLRWRASLGVQPCVIVIEAGSASVMLVGWLALEEIPLRFGRRSITRKMARLLRFAAGGPRGTPDERTSAALLASLDVALRQTGALAAVLPHIKVGTPLHSVATSLPFWRRDLSEEVQPRRRHRFDRGKGRFLESISRNERQQQRRRWRKFTSAFPDAHVLQAPGDLELAAFLKRSEQVANRSWLRKIGRGFQSSRKYEMRAQFEASLDFFRGFLIVANERPVAFWIGSIYSKTFYSNFLAHDPEFDDYSIGTMLMISGMEYLHDNARTDIDIIDFGTDNTGYKERYSTEEWNEQNLVIGARSLGGILFSLCRNIFGSVNFIGRRVLALHARGWRMAKQPARGLK